MLRLLFSSFAFRFGRLSGRLAVACGLLWLSITATQAQQELRTLDEFLTLSRSTSPLLRDFAGQVAQNRLDSLRRRAQQRPQITGNGAAVAAPIIHRRPNGEGGFGYDEAVSNGGNYAAYVGATQPVLGGPVLRNDYRILESQGLVLRNNRQLAALDLRRTVTDQFLTAYAAEQQWTYNQELLRTLNQQDALLRKLVNGGVYKQTQYLAFYASVRNQEVTTQQARLTYRRELGTLRYLAGSGDTALVLLNKPQPPTHRTLAGLGSITQRQYTLDSLRLRLDREAVDLSYRPKLNWVLDAGLQSANPAPLYLTHNVGFSGGLTLTLPIFDGHQRQLSYERIRISEQIRTGYRAFLTTQRRQQYQQLEGLTRESDQLIASIRRQLGIAAALVDAGRQQLTTGDITILDYLQLVSSYRGFQFSLTQAETERLRNLFALDYLGE
ncbi:TolC family protein [Hymenobacter sp. 15J16-1T3B]|uniref:TolC family protein n=1 Tax=Hymenobacter sp. 15J16-1T3B TaxID=2886941 RepID=UPI001D12A9D6|nr:TolC family protein [Hymenobacter sp. 15J16-1T3B]MCC3160167.1 TolC family protein [Hymenobacter sp. 15J16-1T3B]